VDFEDKLDLLDFRTSGLHWSDLKVAQQGADVLVSEAAGTDTILLANKTAALITQQDFLF
jgi:hypothetical protein